MTIPRRAADKNAAAPLNGLSPTRSNRFLGFELMKIGTGARDRSRLTQDAPPRWHDVNPAETATAAAARFFAAPSGSKAGKGAKNA
jgi:hypothetical protein